MRSFILIPSFLYFALCHELMTRCEVQGLRFSSSDREMCCRPGSQYLWEKVSPWLPIFTAAVLALSEWFSHQDQLAAVRCCWQRSLFFC